ncbi:class I SAM-dependent methyltransferase [archaeon]|nr:MAG: class I SAM-dependent methyltransferase [archaeon]
MFTGKIYGKWMAATQREKLEKILEEVGIKNIEGKNILDVGSGPGFLSAILRKSQKSGSVVSSDIDIVNLKMHENLRFSACRKSCRFSCKASGLKVLASGDFLPFGKVFDVVFCIDAIHLLDKKRIGAEFAKVLKDSGILVVSAFCNKYTSDGKMKELEEALRGFEIKKRFLAKTENEWDAVVVASLNNMKDNKYYANSPSNQKLFLSET